MKHFKISQPSLSGFQNPAYGNSTKPTMTYETSGTLTNPIEKAAHEIQGLKNSISGP
jgi:hypothetical protein